MNVKLLRFAPGLFLCAGISGIAYFLQALEEFYLDHVYLEALVIAIILGVIVRTAWAPGDRWESGIRFSGKFLLEVAVVLLGAALSFGTVMALGPQTLLGIVLVVMLTIVFSYACSRLLGLSKRMSILVACGNSICGNSAIAAVAPVVGAEGREVASSIAFTAVFGVLIVLLLPLIIPLLNLTFTQYGVLVGLTVYAVPQVLAATMPVNLLANQIGTVVKLVRVLMLGPVTIVLSLLTSRGAFCASPEELLWERHGMKKRSRLAVISQCVPWFIIGFVLMAIARSADLIPQSFIGPTNEVAKVLTTISMAALGLGVDFRSVAKAGPRLTAAVGLSLLFLTAISLFLIHLFAIG
ncbi:YeiH family protein [Shinella daejeonensis]|uniref:YeiH family protein n=1 Tax=Shinella daejeonensis TaxID=659017 RepID=UPI0020C7F8B3|nr:YeiH family protein [Shinella daejeonensis]MCP8894578.1 YeiH family protein [Shinella daejeonensis]